MSTSPPRADPSQTAPPRTTPPRAVRTWLTVVFLSIVLMTAIGGITRLTGSGLSMVQWHPLMGALPPLSEADWLDVFDKYKQTPQYALVNSWMTLADFKRIFFWEYIHRLWGRSIGLIVAVPWLWFLVRRQLGRSLALRCLGLIVLGGSQGLLGWYMVQSGLVDQPQVSHLRLAAHLLLAFFVAQATVWVRLSIQPPARARAAKAITTVALVGLSALLFVQSAWGAFMAGTRAGWFASTFPDVNGVYSPATLAGNQGLWHAILFEPGPIHATHRLLAWLALLVGGGVVALMLRDGAPQLRRPAVGLSTLLGTQIVLGALTVIYEVPLVIAVAHQVVGLLLLSAVTWGLQRATCAAPSPEPS